MATVASNQASVGPSRLKFPPPLQGQWTYDDYAALPDNGYRYEVIDGNLHMSPSPTWKHQLVLSRLMEALLPYVNQREGRVVTAPMDLLMEDIATPVQPDIIVTLPDRLSIFANTGRLEGVPTVLIEVLSPSTRKHDERTKLDAYFRAGVPEYWIVDPVGHTLAVHVRRGDAWAPIVFAKGDQARSEALPDLTISVDGIFSF